MAAVARTRANQVRCFSNTHIQYDLIQDLYLKELNVVRNNLDMSKLTSPEGNVLQWKPLAKPVVPGVEDNEEAILQDYIKSSVSTESDPNSIPEQQEVEEDWLVIDEVKKTE